MTRLVIHVEGQTEESFVNEVLRDHLMAKGYGAVWPRLLGGGAGGVGAWQTARKDIMSHLRQYPGSIATTMVDYYGMPPQKNKGWPTKGANQDTATKAKRIEDALRDDVAKGMGPKFNCSRFIPFVLMHEFEGLLFSDCAAFSQGICRPDLEPALRSIRNGFATPEDINDSNQTAPSKRISKLIPSYEKPLLGTLAAMKIGLDRIRQECPHFREWIERLESLAG